MPDTVLLVDDDAQLLHIAEMVFQLEGYNVVTAASGAKAMEALTQVRPDVIFLDIMMPDIDGAEVCRRIRADPKLRHVPIAVFTAAETRDQELLEAGADEFIVKPYSVEGLREVAKRLVAAGGQARDDGA